MGTSYFAIIFVKHDQFLSYFREHKLSECGNEGIRNIAVIFLELKQLNYYQILQHVTIH